MMPTNSNKVRFIKNNKLFVEVNDFVVEIANPFDYEPEYVALVNVDGEYFVKGYEPQKTIAKSYKKDKETKEERD